MNAELIRLVWRRAGGCCEYCRMPQTADDAGFEIDHIIAQKNKGRTVASNLCLSCYFCNSYKGSDLASIDRTTRKLTPLFNPRRHKWTKHFLWEGAVLVGCTPIGRTTVNLLRINDPFRIKLREELIAEGNFPPE